jgi:hypothetical protein
MWLALCACMIEVYFVCVRVKSVKEMVVSYFSFLFCMVYPIFFIKRYRHFPSCPLLYSFFAESSFYIDECYSGCVLCTLNHLYCILCFLCVICTSLDSVVGIVISYRLDNRGVRVQVPVESRIFSSPHRPDWLWGPPNLLSPEVKQLGHEADHSPPASAKVKKMWIYKSTPSYVFMV